MASLHPSGSLSLALQTQIGRQLQKANVQPVAPPDVTPRVKDCTPTAEELAELEEPDSLPVFRAPEPPKKAAPPAAKEPEVGTKADRKPPILEPGVSLINEPPPAPGLRLNPRPAQPAPPELCERCTRLGRPACQNCRKKCNLA